MVSPVVGGNSEAAKGCLERAVALSFARASVNAKFAWGPLVEIVLQLLVQYVQQLDCMKPTAEQIAQRLANAESDTLVRMAIRNAVQQANKARAATIVLDARDQSLARQGLRSGFVGMSHADRLALCNELVA